MPTLAHRNFSRRVGLAGFNVARPISSTVNCIRGKLRVMSRTLYVYRDDGGSWVVRKEGRKAAIFPTKREAVATAIQSGRNSKPAQVVVLGSNGQLLAHKSYGLPKIQEFPKRGRLTARKIANAVGLVTLNRLKASGELANQE